MPRHVQEIGQIDRTSYGRTTLKNYQRCKLVHGGTLQTLISDGSGVKTFNSAGKLSVSIKYILNFTHSLLLNKCMILGCRWFPVCSRM